MLKRSFSLLWVVTVILSICMQTGAIAANIVTQTDVAAPDNPSDEHAYIIFSDTPKMKNMTFEDGVNQDRYAVTYNEKVVFGNVQARQVFVENYLYLKLDKTFAAEEDRVFAVIIDYWDYSGAGEFYIDYTKEGGGEEYGRLTIPKIGVAGSAPKWHRAVTYIDDASFGGKMPYESDFRIVSRAYNTFSKIEIINLSKTKANTSEEFGIFNQDKAKALHSLGLYQGISQEEFVPALENKLKREEALVEMVKSYGLEQEALSKQYKSSFVDVSASAKPYVGLLENIGVIKPNEEKQLKPDEQITQQELILYYLNLLSVEYTKEDAEKLAHANKLIAKGNFIFQMNKPATRDNFIALALNALVINNVKTQKSAFKTMFESGFFNEESVLNSNDSVLYNWLLTNDFKVTPKTVVDELTGRTYKTMNLLGKNALKQYYTQQCWSTDNKRFYFMDDTSRYFEYNTETNMVKYIDSAPYGFAYAHMVSPKNNLFYINAKNEIIKMNLDTYEKQKVTQIPEWQKSRPFMLQVNNAETLLSLEWRDTSGDFNPDHFSRFPICDLTTGEWDLRWVYGFDTPWYNPDHPCINPVHDNLLFFAHEGFEVNDRIWILNRDTNEYYNVFKQKKYTDKIKGESNVHESWTYDGDWVLTIKTDMTVDGIPQNVGPGRLVMIRYDGTDKRYIPGDADFLHPASSPVTNRWIVSDTSYRGVYTDLYLIDSYTGKSYFLARTPQTGKDPGHAHPHFSQDGNQIIFGLYSDDRKTIQIGYMDVSDIVSTPIEGGHYDLSDSCDTFGYKGFEYYVQVQDTNDGKVFQIPKSNTMYVNVKKEVIESERENANVEITYLDNSLLPIKLEYYIWEPNIGGRGIMAKKKYYVKRTGSGKYKTAKFTIQDMNLGNMELLGSDFKLSGVTSEVIIKSVKVSIPDKEASK